VAGALRQARFESMRHSDQPDGAEPRRLLDGVHLEANSRRFPTLQAQMAFCGRAHGVTVLSLQPDHQLVEFVHAELGYSRQILTGHGPLDNAKAGPRWYNRLQSDQLLEVRLLVSSTFSRSQRANILSERLGDNFALLANF
jgi:hypothetical protein